MTHRLQLPINEQCQRILGEILNSNLSATIERIREYPEAINVIGKAGDAAIHVAVYKREHEILKELLAFGSDPNLKNISKGDTPMHIAARLGDVTMLQILYESGKCDLESPNLAQYSCYDLACLPVDDSDINVLFLYGDWTAKFDYEVGKTEMADGRLRCKEYLTVKLAIDRKRIRESSIDTMINTNCSYGRSVNIIRGKGYFSERVFTRQLNYPDSIDSYPPRSVDINLFRGPSTATEEAVRGIFAGDFTERLVRSAVHSAALGSNALAAEYATMTNPRTKE